jgi:hypothetical protein
MGRNPEIEKILEAWWMVDHCPGPERAKSRTHRDSLLDAVVAKGGGQFTRDQILDFLWPQYKDFCAEKRRAERLGVAQSALKK